MMIDRSTDRYIDRGGWMDRYARNMVGSFGIKCHLLSKKEPIFMASTQIV